MVEKATASHSLAAENTISVESLPNSTVPFESFTVVPDAEYGYERPTAVAKLRPRKPELSVDDCPPPPSLKEALASVPSDLQSLFKQAFRGKLSGVCPVDKTKLL
ncbi:MAG TPA: hypothetical protein DHV51_00700 [Opitutae bacterium]|nr:hypothetical protein [Opitutae bacterium]